MAKTSAAASDARPTRVPEYGTAAPDGQSCPRCRRIIASDEMARRLRIIGAREGMPDVEYEHIRCPKA
ncbi:hypothetical protein ABZ621_29490 [Streptomyces sp. NPDC007863]|uniref:hypothetical protein n=1 Tax=Streptomyces sp. NPDC007863 TaxID=3154894 RepID=UPI0033C67F1D